MRPRRTSTSRSASEATTARASTRTPHSKARVAESIPRRPNTLTRSRYRPPRSRPMSQEHVRTARVLDPGYLADLEQRALEDLRAMHAECLELETEVSYVRRLTQARIDILRAEVQRRERGESM